MQTVKKKITTNSRVVKDLLTKYRDTFQALTELINNSIQADAKEININIEYTGNNLTKSPISKIEIKDNGHGVHYNQFENTILEIGTTSKATGQGIGRFSALQIGDLMEISTVGFDQSKKNFTRTNFALDSTTLNNSKFTEIEFQIEYEEINDKKAKSGYSVVIKNLHHNKQEKIAKRNALTEGFLEKNFKQTLFEHYPYQIFNDSVKFNINGVVIKRDDFIHGLPTIKKTPYIDKKGLEHATSFYFYKVKAELNKVKVFFQTDNGGLKSVAHEFSYSSDWYSDDLGTWFIYVESTMLDSDLFRNLDIESLGETQVAAFKNFVKETINEFFKAKNKRFQKFVLSLEEDSFYPYKDKKTTEIQEIVFKEVAYIIEDEYKLIQKNHKIRQFVYSLLDKALENGHIEEVFNQVLKLSDESLEKFHALLQRTELETVIQFSNQVAEKLEFIEFLHELTYGEISKVLKERSQLHKVIENELWLFGENYNGTPHLWSDKKIGKIFAEIRQKFFHYEPSAEDENLIEIQDFDGLNDITDLYFTNEKVLDDDCKEFMVVELKSPKCAIGQKELAQIDKYAYAIENHDGLSNDKVKYKLILISSRLTDYAQSKMDSSYEKYRIPHLYDIKTKKRIEVYVMRWSDLLEQNKRKLGYLSKQLTIKDKSVKEKFEKEYPELIDSKVSARLTKVG
jgi:hypothetical protein